MTSLRYYPLKDFLHYGVLGSRRSMPRAARFIYHDGRAKAKDGDITAPAPDGAIWPCGHPRTQANTQSVGAAGFLCRICRRALNRRCGSKVRGNAE